MENRDGCGADMLGLGAATAQTAGGAIGLLETQTDAFYAIADIEARDWALTLANTISVNDRQH